MDSHRDHFEKLAEIWDSFQPQDRVKVIDDLLVPHDGLFIKARRILDIGTGTGSIIPLLNSRYPHSKIISIDLAFEMLVRARQRCKNASLVQADVHHLPFEDGGFSSIICHNSLPHFRNKPSALREFMRLLESKGNLLILHDNNRETINKIHRDADACILHDDILPDGASLGSMLKDAGFITDIIDDGEDHFIVAGHII